jgi:hypothetical protein
VSVLRAGYVVAAVETDLGGRTGPDEHLMNLFQAMGQEACRYHGDDDRSREISLGAQLGEVAAMATFENPHVGRGFPGFRLREAVFADLRHTLFTKLKASNFPHWPGGEIYESAMRFGHAVGVCEESLPDVHPVRGEQGSNSPPTAPQTPSV